MTNTPTVADLVAVKPLEWKGPDLGGDYMADHPFGWYDTYHMDTCILLYKDGLDSGAFETLDAAKAAAEADYKARILSALSPAATEPVAWQQRHHDGSWLMCPKGWNAKDRDDWPAIYRPLYAAPPSPVTVEAAAVAALSAYQQADMDGTMVLVSRQAIEECLPALRALAGEKS